MEDITREQSTETRTSSGRLRSPEVYKQLTHYTLQLWYDV
jgi:hypothetical protein